MVDLRTGQRNELFLHDSQLNEKEKRAWIEGKAENQIILISWPSKGVSFTIGVTSALTGSKSDSKVQAP